MQQRPERVASPSIEEGRRGVRSGGAGLQRRETTLMEGMQDVAHRLIGTAQVARNHGSGLALGTGQQDLAAAYRKGGRGPETDLERGPLVRRERAHK